jgi:type I restriction enzyme M protein
MNLTVHGLSGKILDANTYRDPVFEAAIKEAKGFDFVMANPPFNVKELDKTKLFGVDARYPYGIPTADNVRLAVGRARLTRNLFLINRIRGTVFE